ncbi:unnamed protein product [Bursaphelenchus xylophilus]|uniref:(pine wood nematode) hypothetical protein n=1 Tax=Bursaphelenchus xylophilus TaxID=6326 RepID=A0A1I7SLW8_BURXY|nr:unnamed protein product [Bursaphelenchus xylophilus]CAG9129892.1 unnamed protein product [Bursaphelenchus xylophilus]
MMPNECESCVVSIRDFQDHARKLSKKFGEPGVAEGVFLDLIEDFCPRMMEYRVHREKAGVQRFQKSESALIHKLKDMASKGTNIKADIPMNLWDEPPVEAARLKFDCEKILEENEEILEKWFHKTRFDKDLVDAVCYNADDAPCKNGREDL